MGDLVDGIFAEGPLSYDDFMDDLIQFRCKRVATLKDLVDLRKHIDIKLTEVTGVPALVLPKTEPPKPLADSTITGVAFNTQDMGKADIQKTVGTDHIWNAVKPPDLPEPNQTLISQLS